MKRKQEKIYYGIDIFFNIMSEAFEYKLFKSTTKSELIDIIPLRIKDELGRWGPPQRRYWFNTEDNRKKCIDAIYAWNEKTTGRGFHDTRTEYERMEIERRRRKREESKKYRCKNKKKKNNFNINNWNQTITWFGVKNSQEN